MVDMKINYLLSGWHHTGGGMVLYKFMDKLCERGYKVCAISPKERVEWRAGYAEVLRSCFARGGLVSCMKSMLKRHLPVTQIRQKFGKSPLEQVKLINQGLVRNWVPCHVTIATACQTAYAAYALSGRSTVLYHMQSWEEDFFQDELSRRMARLTYHMPIGLMANSTWLKERVKREVGRQCPLLLPGVDQSMFFPRKSPREKFSRDHTVRIVSYYAPHPWKGWADGVEAMKRVFKAVGRDNLEWMVFGDRPPTDPGVPVSFLGRVFGEALAELYASADILFMPSWFESFPLPPIEAMACGTAVIVTGPGTEDYAVDGENALVRPPRDPTSLADAILRLVQDRTMARHLAEAGVETAQRMDWDAATDVLEAIVRAARADPSSTARGCSGLC